VPNRNMRRRQVCVSMSITLSTLLANASLLSLVAVAPRESVAMARTSVAPVARAIAMLQPCVASTQMAGP